jgi:hypothetical protein
LLGYPEIIYNIAYKKLQAIIIPLLSALVLELLTGMVEGYCRRREVSSPRTEAAVGRLSVFIRVIECGHHLTNVVDLIITGN